MPTATVCLQSANDFKQYLQENEKSPLTVEKYLRDALFFCRFAAGEEVTKQTVLAFKNHLRERYAPASVNSMLVAVNSFLLFLGKGGMSRQAAEDPAADLLQGGKRAHRQRIPPS